MNKGVNYKTHILISHPSYFNQNYLNVKKVQLLPLPPLQP